jgi:RNA-directed DNA polymerase
MNKWNTWSDINWKTVERQVFKLQKRIYRASQRGDVKLVHKLQRLLIKSYYGRLLATRRVTQDNQGKKTAGVDGVKSLNPKQSLEMVDNLKITGKAKPSRRVWIPKPGTEEKRPLSIPVIYDRCLQSLVKLALEPQWEADFEPNSYGFRPGRSPHDAIGAIYIAINQKPKYILDADIAKCFDRINHNKLLDKINTYPSLRRQIKAWLKNGVLDKGVFSDTTEGTPQGGVVSPLLANIALHGMEKRVKQYARTLKGCKEKNEKALSLIRYADDFVILHKDLKVILECQEIIKDWLLEIGLELKPSKTKITHTLNEYKGNVGFDFLGFTIRQFPVGKDHSGKDSHKKLLGFKTIIRASKEKIKLHTKKIGDTIWSMKASSQTALIAKLNPIIRGWCNYYKSVVCKEIFSDCDHNTYLQLKRWAERRHPNKPKSWVKKKYWKSGVTKAQGWSDWIFKTIDDENAYELIKHSDIKQQDHIKVEGDKSPFNGELVYWSSRMGKNPECSTEMATLLKRQKGKCNHCGLTFKDGDLIETDHILPKVLGGKNDYGNKQLLHRHCHDKKTETDGSLRGTPIDKIPESTLQIIAKQLHERKIKNGNGKLTAWEFQVLRKSGLLTCTHDKGFIKEELCEVKVSCTVLKTSVDGDVYA